MRTDHLRIRHTATVEVSMDEQAEIRAQLEVAEQRLALAVLTRSDDRVILRMHVTEMQEQLCSSFTYDGPVLWRTTLHLHEIDVRDPRGKQLSFVER